MSNESKLFEQLIQKAESLIIEKKYSMALEVLHSLYEVYPNDKSVLNNLSVVLALQKKYDEATYFICKVLEIDNSDKTALDNAGMLKGLMQNDSAFIENQLIKNNSIAAVQTGIGTNFYLKTRNEFGRLLNSLQLRGEGIEIGVQAGDFSKQFRGAWDGKTLHLLDRWRYKDDYYEAANVTDVEHEGYYLSLCKYFFDDPGVVIHKMESTSAAAIFPDSYFDFIYLDAEHDYNSVKRDLNLWYPKLKRNGIFAGHDLIDGVGLAGVYGVKSAVSEFVNFRNYELYATQEEIGNSWFFVKK